MTAPPAAPAPAQPTGYRILPVYLVLDTAVAGAAGAAATGAVVPAVRDVWAVHPALSDALRLAVADAGAQGQVRLPLCDPLDPDVVPPVLPRGGPPAGAALTAVRAAVEKDVRDLAGDGFVVPRPLVCLVLGTAPDGSWGAGLGALTVSATAPVVVLCCLGTAVAEARTLADAAVGEAVAAVYTTDPTLPPDRAVDALTEVVTTVLVRTGHTLGADGAVVLPAADELPVGVTEVVAPPGTGDRAD